MPETQPPDKVQREISEILDKLDNFVPEERLASKIRHRSRQQREAAGPNAVQRAVSRVSRVGLGQMMLAGLGLMLIGWLFDDALGDLRVWVQAAGVLLLVSAFVLSIIQGGRDRTISGQPRYTKRWRGQVIEYGDPTPTDRLRGWWRRRRK